MSRKFECYTYTPVTPVENSLPDDFGLTMGTPVSAFVRDAMGQDGNVGAQARYLSQELGVKVAAYQDLGPKVTFPQLRKARYAMHPRNFPEYAAETAGAVGSHLKEDGITRTAMRIHSGSGPLGTSLALALHNNNRLSVTHLAISDPAGLKEVSSFWAGLKLYLAFQYNHQRHLPEEHRCDPGQPPNTFPAFIGDILVRGQVWRTPVTLNNLQQIHDKTDTAVLLHLPGRTFNGGPDEMQALSQLFGDRPTEAPFEVDYQPNDFHGSSYDRYARNAAFIRQTLALAPLT